MINIDDITLQISGKTLLEKASCFIGSGLKVGIVGKNGCGKSTLFRALHGEIDVLAGSISFPKNIKIVAVEQEIRDVNINIIDFVLKRDRELTFWREKLSSASDEELSLVYERLADLKSDSAESRIASILNGLGFSDEDMKKNVSEFSGGWRMRLALAGALFQSSDIMLLDEPTNHLDLEATLWLENYLNKYSGTLLVISHDKNLLNNICSHILHFEGEKLSLYGGNYDSFEKNFLIKKQNNEKMLKKQQEKREHLESFINRFRYKASKAKQAQSRIKMLEKMKADIALLPDEKDLFILPSPSEILPPFITVSGVSVGYTETPVLKRLNFSISENERIGLLGRNGNGKSTLAKLLTGILKPMEGEIRASSKLEIGFFNQHQSEELPENETPVSYIFPYLKDKTETEIRSYLAGFGLTDDKAITLIKHLSGGEKARLLLAKICIKKPHLLILDEPTNHLDIAGRDALIDALNAYKGSVVLITHDFHILESVCDSLWIVQNGSCNRFDGDLGDYKKMLLDTKSDDKKTKPEQGKKVSSDRTIRPSKNKIKKLEDEIFKLEMRKGEIMEIFSNPSDNCDFENLSKELKNIEKSISEKEEEWIFQSELLDSTKH